MPTHQFTYPKVTPVGPNAPKPAPATGGGKPQR
jgi:hypothetical protein